MFFDFGGTLCRSRGDLAAVFRAAARRAGVELPMEAFLRANEEWWSRLWPEAPGLVGRLPSFADRVHELSLRTVGVEGPTERLVQYIREAAISPLEVEPFPETVETLTRLRDRGIPLHLLSENVDYLPLLLQNLGWSQFFETVTFTQEVGAHKPDARVFQFALERARRSASESVYVGDSWVADYLGATQAGMMALWLNREGAVAPAPCRQIATLREVEGWVDTP